MAIKKELSKCCTNCGVEWLEDFSNKQPKRAKCLECYDIELFERNANQRKSNKENKNGLNRLELYENYKYSNRKPFWTSINKQIKLLKNREEAKEFISKQMDRILADKTLMDYINLTEIVEKNKKK